jgi:hypothetical protein
VEQIKKTPVIGQLITLIDRYPRIAAWIVLSTGIIILLVREAQDVGLTTRNWVALIVASILVSGLCIWIVSWEDEEEAEASIEKSNKKPKGEKPVVKVQSEEGEVSTAEQAPKPE